jgi:hypothetical protein
MTALIDQLLPLRLLRCKMRRLGEWGGVAASSAAALPTSNWLP